MKLLLVLFLSIFLFAKNYEAKFLDTKLLYLRSVIDGNKEKQKNYLKELIQIGKKLNKDISKYQIELKKLVKTDKKKFFVSSYKKKKKVSKNFIKDIYTLNNSIIIKFKYNIKKNILKQSKWKNKYIFDIKTDIKKIKRLSIYKIKRIKLARYKKNITRIVIENNKKLNFKITFYKTSIVIKILFSKKKKKTNIIKLPFNPKEKTIVIDPGHGGKDTGAIGPYRGYFEKKLVLSIAKKVYKILKKRGYRVYLTRKGDYFISLRYRTKFANRKKASVFVSIHANSVPRKKAKKVKGIETFFLSPTRSKRANKIASIENSFELKNLNYRNKNTILFTLNRANITEAHKLSIDIQKNVLFNTRKIYKDVVDMGVREGPFWVLVGANMPSVLIEVGYISHPKEARRLFKKRYQEAIAKGIADGIESYFYKNNLR